MTYILFSNCSRLGQTGLLEHQILVPIYLNISLERNSYFLNLYHSSPGSGRSSSNSNGIVAVVPKSEQQQKYSSKHLVNWQLAVEAEIDSVAVEAEIGPVAGEAEIGSVAVEAEVGSVAVEAEIVAVAEDTAHCGNSSMGVAITVI